MIYLDNGATTSLDPAVLDSMMPYLRDHYGNPSSLHQLGAAASRGIQESREIFSDILGVDTDEIIFTGGGTEADNMGIRGAALAASPKRRHALLFVLEHPAVANQDTFLESLGFEVEIIPCDTQGILDMDALEQLIRPEQSSLVAVMHANNEIGTIQPIAEIGELIEDLCPSAAFHVDAVQSFTKLPVRPKAMGASTVALAAHKIHGPKGVGLLVQRKGARVHPLMVGGGQENKRRPGTQNVAGIVGFAAAARAATENQAADVRAMTQLRDHLIGRLVSEIDGIQLNGHAEKRLCNNINVNLLGARAEVLLHALEEHGVIVSSGSACHSGQSGPSHVLKSIGCTEKDTGCLRITMSRHSTLADVDECATALAAVVSSARL